MTIHSNNHDQSLWQSFCAGDNDALHELYNSFYEPLFEYGCRFCKDALLAEDGIQDLFLKLIRSRQHLTQPVQVKNYLFRSYRNLLVDKLRTSNRVDSTIDPEFLLKMEVSSEENFVDKQVGNELELKLQNAVEKLTSRQREAIFFRYTEGLSYLEVAELLNLSPKATYKLMARALQTLREACLSFLPILPFL